MGDRGDAPNPIAEVEGEVIVPALFNPETSKPVGFRCDEHRDAPVHNLNADEIAECATCALMDGANQGADNMLKHIGAVVDAAAIRLEFFAQGAGESFRRQAAQILQGESPETQETKQ